MKNINNVSVVMAKCCRCNNCINTCPEKAISFFTNENSTVYPIINDKCINCGACLEKCPIINSSFKDSYTNKQFYWFVNPSNSIVNASSSGGFFYEAAKAFLQKGGIVYAARFESSKVIFDCFDSITNIGPYLKSKYVESSTRQTFKEIRSRLIVGESIMFVGSPCQVAALKLFTDNHENLTTIDFVCGGMPLKVIFENYIQFLENKYKSKIVSLNFRPKKISWRIHQLEIVFENKKRLIETMYKNPYLYYFVLNKKTIRESCFTCEYKGKHHSDLIIADYWKASPELISKFKSGISLVTINSKKGEELFNSIPKSNNYFGSLNELDGNYIFNKVYITEKEKNSFIQDRNLIIKKGVTTVFKKQPIKTRTALFLKDILYKYGIKK